MRFDVMTLFPEQVYNALNQSVIGRAIANNAFVLQCHNIRDYSKDKHKRVDDAPYGGGYGMVMTPQPIANCYNSIVNDIGEKPYCIYMSPQGKTLTQKKAALLLDKKNITLLCGHYEGIDQRVLDEIVDEEISIGDYVLTGGEMPAIVLIDVIARMIDGVLSSSDCYKNESHYANLLEHPQYTRPKVYNNIEVPKVLQNGDHAKIEQWKKEKSLENTTIKRPDLLSK